MVANLFLEQYIITPSDPSVCDAPDAANVDLLLKSVGTTLVQKKKKSHVI